MIYVFCVTNRCDVKPVPIETAVRFNFSAMRYAPGKKVKSLYLEKKERKPFREPPDISGNLPTAFLPRQYQNKPAGLWRSGQLVTISVIRQMRVRQVCCSLSDDTEELSTWLQTCVLGTRKTNGEKYPARALSTTPAAATDPQQQPCCFSGAHLQNCTINTVITITEHKLQSCMLLLLVFW